jgi:hypothetical protein
VYRLQHNGFGGQKNFAAVVFFLRFFFAGKKRRGSLGLVPCQHERGGSG